MKLYAPSNKSELVDLYYVVNDKQLEYIVNYQFKSFPARFFTQKYFCPILDKEYAIRIASERSNWVNVTDYVHVMRFIAFEHIIKHYVHGSISNHRSRIIIPNKDLSKLNSAIVGYIERVEKIDINHYQFISN